LAPHNVYTSHKDYGEIDAEHRELMLPFINIDKELYAFGYDLFMRRVHVAQKDIGYTFLC